MNKIGPVKVPQFSDFLVFFKIVKHNGARRALLLIRQLEIIGKGKNVRDKKVGTAGRTFV